MNSAEGNLRLAALQRYMSRTHDIDFVRALKFIIDRDDLEGAVNLAAPHPLPHKDLMGKLRRVLDVFFGLPVTRWMVEVGAYKMRADFEERFAARLRESDLPIRQ
jgi:uncharacterized protein